MKELIGLVTSNKMQKSVVVQVTRLARHPKYGKALRIRKKYTAHDETDRCNPGDLVRMVQTRPLSKTKRWSVEEVIREQRLFESGTKATVAAAAAAQKPAPFSTFASAGLLR